ncbi:hypothetical protein [Pedobacter sp.]|uniref:hypothetical protein n=1 Tax=Pedobacter sp. TaxID=1411316 RepID=UPI0031D5D882
MKKSESTMLNQALLKGLIDYEREVGQREVEFSVPQLFDLKLPKDLNDFNVVPDGSILAIVTKKGSSLLKRLIEAIKSKDFKLIVEIIKDLIKGYIDNLSSDLDTNGIANVPVLAEIRYGSKTLARGLSVDLDEGAITSVFAYAGGKIKEADFKFVQFKKANENADLEVILLKRDPELSELEKQILSRVPASEAEVNISEERALAKVVVEFAKRAVKKVVETTPQMKKTAMEYAKEITKTVAVETIMEFTKQIMQGGRNGKGQNLTKESSPLNENSTVHDLLEIRRAALLSSKKGK